MISLSPTKLFPRAFSEIRIQHGGHHAEIHIPGILQENDRKTGNEKIDIIVIVLLTNCWLQLLYLAFSLSTVLGHIKFPQNHTVHVIVVDCAGQTWMWPEHSFLCAVMWCEVAGAQTWHRYGDNLFALYLCHMFFFFLLAITHAVVGSSHLLE